MTAAVRPAPRAFVSGYVRALLLPVAGLAVLLAGWQLTSATGLPAATAAVTSWAVVVSVGLRRRRWQLRRILVVSAAPAALLAALAALGWLAAAGLVLWAPITTVLAIALTLTARQPNRDR